MTRVKDSYTSRDTSKMLVFIMCELMCILHLTTIGVPCLVGA